MTTREMIIYFFGGTAAIIFFISVSYWSVNFFIRQCSERIYQQFKAQLAREAERAIMLFREGICEQIVQQENKSDSLAKLYATLIDLLRVGKDFSASLGKGDLQQADKMFRGIRNTSETFSDNYHKQRLQFPDDFCLMLDYFIKEQKAAVEQIEANWRPTRRDPLEGLPEDALIKQNWHRLEDRITRMMDTMRGEFRKRNPSGGNVMMKWLNETPEPKNVPAP